MNPLIPASAMHYYDVRTRTIACGATGPDQRSTKHARQVTCPACLALVGDRTARGAVPPGAAPDAAHP